MLPLRDNLPTRRFPVVTVGLIGANVLAFVLYQDAGQGAGFATSLDDLAFHPCEVDTTCPRIGSGWPIALVTSMFLHAGWGHLLGNMLFLWIFGNNVEDALGRPRFLVFYLLGGIAATAAQTFVTLGWGSIQDAALPNVGASGAISAVLGAYFVLHPHGRVLTFVFPFFLFEIPAVVFLGIYFLMQLVVGGLSFVSPSEGGGVAYFAHLGGFLFGLLAVRPFAAGRRRPRTGY